MQVRTTVSEKIGAADVMPAEYWAGSLEIHSLEGFGVDAFLQISKLGNKNERLTTRATMDAI